MKTQWFCGSRADKISNFSSNTMSSKKIMELFATIYAKIKLDCLTIASKKYSWQFSMHGKWLRASSVLLAIQTRTILVLKIAAVVSIITSFGMLKLTNLEKQTSVSSKNTMITWLIFIPLENFLSLEPTTSKTVMLNPRPVTTCTIVLKK